jgi:hypothetical protein
MLASIAQLSNTITETSTLITLDVHKLKRRSLCLNIYEHHSSSYGELPTQGAPYTAEH